MTRSSLTSSSSDSQVKDNSNQMTQSDLESANPEGSHTQQNELEQANKLDNNDCSRDTQNPSPEGPANEPKEPPREGSLKTQSEPQGKETRGSINVGGKKRYPCPFPGCDKTFSTSGHSSRHSRIHTGEKPYRCSYPGCNAQFSRYDNSLQHYRTHIISSKGGKKSRGKTGAQKNADAVDVSEINRQARSAIAVNTTMHSGAPAYPNTPVTVDSRSTRPIPSTSLGNTVHPVPAYSTSPVTRMATTPSSTGLDGPVVGSYIENKLIPISTEAGNSDSILPGNNVEDAYVAPVYAPRTSDGYKKIRLHATEAPLTTSATPVEMDRVQYVPSYGVVNSRNLYPSQSHYMRPSLKRESRTWHELVDGAGMPPKAFPTYLPPMAEEDHKKPRMWPDVYEHKRLASDPVSLYGASAPHLSVPSPASLVSPQRIATPGAGKTGEKPPLVESRTFDFGARVNPSSGADLDQQPSSSIHDASESSKSSSGKISSRHGAESPTLQSRPSSFRMRKSGSMPSLLTLEMPRSESSHSLSKYSLSSGTPATTNSVPAPASSGERALNRPGTTEQLTSEQQVGTANEDRKGLSDQELVLPPLSRLS